MGTGARQGLYRLMLILPYAVPGFISIPVFRGLFNQNFGEINLLLEGLFGIRPDWFSDPTSARTMILIVNTARLPYMLLLCMGLLQAILRISTRPRPSMAPVRWTTCCASPCRS